MKSNLFGAHEVLAAGQVPREGESEALDVCSVPIRHPPCTICIIQEILTATRECDGRSTVGHGRDLVDLEPDVAAAIPVGDIAGSLGKVDVDNAIVIHVTISLNTDGRASSDSDGRSSSAGSRSVAAEVGAVHISDLEDVELIQLELFDG